MALFIWLNDATPTTQWQSAVSTFVPRGHSQLPRPSSAACPQTWQSLFGNNVLQKRTEPAYTLSLKAVFLSDIAMASTPQLCPRKRFFLLISGFLHHFGEKSRRGPCPPFPADFLQCALPAGLQPTALAPSRETCNLTAPKCVFIMAMFIIVAMLNIVAALRIRHAAASGKSGRTLSQSTNPGASKRRMADKAVISVSRG
ncbi:MAG: hypothetical protein JO356_04795 [Acidobacteria bacterium]|nr:hypothetical protein [Acidobacteriota bacterium]